MTRNSLEDRVAALEEEQARLRRIVEQNALEVPSWKTYAGSWANDPDHDEAMRLGREYRESLRPKTPRRRKV